MRQPVYEAPRVPDAQSEPNGVRELQSARRAVVVHALAQVPAADAVARLLSGSEAAETVESAGL